MAITNLFSTLSISLQTITPSLQAAAQGMDGAEFCRFTEKVRDHYAAGEFLDLHNLLEGRGVEPTMEGARQMIFARMQIFQEGPPVGILGNLRTETAKTMLTDPSRIFRFLQDSGYLSPEDYYSDLIYELRHFWVNLKTQIDPSQWENFLLDVKDLLTRADGALGHLRTRQTWKTVAEEYHTLGRREDALEIYRNLENDALNDDSDEGTEHENWKFEDLVRDAYLPLGYFDEAERLLKTHDFPNSHRLFMALAKRLIEAGQKERARTLLTEKLCPEALARVQPHPEEAAFADFDLLFRTARLLLMADLKEEASCLLRPLSEAPLKAVLLGDRDDQDVFATIRTMKIVAALTEATKASEVEHFLNETVPRLFRSAPPSYFGVSTALELATFAKSFGVSDDTVRALIEVFSMEDYAKHASQPAEHWFDRMRWDSELLTFTKMRLKRMTKSGK